MHSEETDLKVKIVGDDDDAIVAEQFDLATPTGVQEFGAHGDCMPVTPDRQSSTDPDPVVAFSSLSIVVIGSPHCTYFSALQEFRRQPEKG